MFPSSNYSFRSRNENNMRDIPGMTRRQTPSARSPFQNARTPPSMTPCDERDTGYFGRPNVSRFCEIDDYPLPARSTSFNEVPFRNSPSATPRMPYAEQRVSFEQAAANMHSALQHACKEFPKIEKAFHEQTQRLTLWLPPQLVDPLWTIYLDWNGIPLDRAKTTSTPPLPSFSDITNRFAKALDALKMSAPPSSPGFGNDVSWEVLQTTMRKLQISLEAIEALLGVVRSHRDRMGPVVREMGSATGLLEGMREVWECKGKGKGKEREIPTPRMGASRSSRRPPQWEREYDIWEGAEI